MTQVIPADAGSAVSKVARTAGMILAGCLVTVMMIRWAGRLPWLGGEGVIALVHWF